MGNETRILVIGAGTMGGAYARLLAGGRVAGATLAGVVDVDGARALQLGGATGAPAFGDIANALANTKPDAAYVATPDALHRKPVQQLAAFVRSMDGEGRTRATFNEGLEVTKILVAIHKSLESGNAEPV